MQKSGSEKAEQVRASLAPELRPVFDELVEHYKFAATKCHGRAYISYEVVAELVRLGWRLGPEGEDRVGTSG